MQTNWTKTHTHPLYNHGSQYLIMLGFVLETAEVRDDMRWQKSDGRDDTSKKNRWMQLEKALMCWNIYLGKKFV